MRIYRQHICSTLHLILCCLQVVCSYFGLSARKPLLTSHLGYQPSTLEERRGGVASGKLCDMMLLERKQRRLCRRGRGIADTLLEATRISVLECQLQFRSERWDCALVDQFRLSLLRKGFKETSFLFAVSSASLVHTFARACSRGSIDRCTCDESKHLKNKEAWFWGGCGDNIKFGLKFSRRFLRASKSREKDIRAKVDQHNSRLGRKVVKEKVKTTCKCHGISGSCTVRTCWRQLSPFLEIGELLKQKYDNAFKVVTYTNQATGKSQLVKRLQVSGDLAGDSAAPRTGDMVCLDDSPTFCRPSRYSSGTSGRVCYKEKNCDVMCCGRGYNVQSKMVKSSCQCQVHWCCYVECKQCQNQEEIYMCK